MLPLIPRRHGGFATRFILTSALCLALAPRATAGTIGFTIDTSVTTGDGVQVHVTVRHTGDEAAVDVVPTIELLDTSVAGTRVERLAPGATQAWDIDVQRENLPPGIYTLLVRIGYGDANAYPFEVIAVTPFDVEATPNARVGGVFKIPPFPGKDTVEAELTLTFPATRGDEFHVEVAVPSGVSGEGLEFPLVVGRERVATLPFRLSNLTLLAGTTIPLFALITSQDEEVPQTDLVRGTLSVVTPEEHLTTGLLIQVIAALAALLVLAQIYFWLKERSRGR